MILSVSVGLNIATFSLDTYPFLYPKVKEKYFKEKTISSIDEHTKEVILDRSMEMAQSSKITMVWNEPKGVTREILSRKNITHSNDFRKYNYPRAFLYYGISENLIKKQDRNKLLDFKLIFDELLDNNGEPSFSINRVDQVPFGLAALNLYKEFDDKKYLLFSDKLYKYILESIEEEGIISYRIGQDKVLNDMLGMVVPFLIEYYHIRGESEALKIARNQMSYYISYGVDKETYLPTHAINKKQKIKIGPTNWGRGVGWYFMALAHYHKETGEFEEEYKGIQNTLLSLKNSEGLWSQFPGSNDVFDASATTMIMYSMFLNDNTLYSKQEILEQLKPYISKKGEILHTSGDTYGLNNYSNTFGKSELSQGMLLLVLSQLEN